MNPNTPQVVPGMVYVDRENAVAEKTYYAPLDGVCYYFQDGHAARFENGVYTTKFVGEQAELDKMVGVYDKVTKKYTKPPTAGNNMFYPYPVEVQRSDAKILKEVSAIHKGVVSSAQLGALTR